MWIEFQLQIFHLKLKISIIPLTVSHLPFSFSVPRAAPEREARNNNNTLHRHRRIAHKHTNTRTTSSRPSIVRVAKQPLSTDTQAARDKQGPVSSFPFSIPLRRRQSVSRRLLAASPHRPPRQRPQKLAPPSLPVCLLACRRHAGDRPTDQGNHRQKPSSGPFRLVSF